METSIIERIWQKAREVEGFPPDLLRQDVCGALIMLSKYNDTTSEYGWGIDHIFPEALGGDDNMLNLRPLHCRNLMSKADDFPVYVATLTSVDGENVEKIRQIRIGNNIYLQLKELYGFPE